MSQLVLFDANFRIEYFIQYSILYDQTSKSISTIHIFTSVITGL